jgi:hypothetical protein
VSRAFPALLAVLLLLAAGAARAEDRISLRGAYYREPSTRVVQPMVEIEKDLPAGFAVGAHYLLDAITSASIAQGNTQDILLNERRNEVRLTPALTFGHNQVSLTYRHSQEPDYLSDALAASLRLGVWENSGTIGVAAGHSFDRVQRVSEGDLNVTFIGLSYEQILSPTLLVQVGYDFYLQRGNIENVYLRGPFGREGVPRERLRHAPSIHLAKYLPGLGFGFQLHYRLYVDSGPKALEPWGLVAHTGELRLHKELGRAFEVRLGYRYHFQDKAAFWCNAVPLAGGDPACYGRAPRYHSIDPKFGNLTTHYPELKLILELHVLEGVPFLGWFSGGAAEIAYGHFFQSTHYADAHVLQLGYTYAF